MRSSYPFFRRAVVGLVSVASLALVNLGTGFGPAVPAEAAPTTTSAGHPYGDPVWFPLRTPASIGCANTGCDNSTSAHGYWAIDFLGAKGDPVYAAGAGIAHIGANSGGCSTTSSDGRWIWIDHGAGVVSRYHHMNRIWITEGQLVTPATKVGELGNSGDIAPCTNNYVHFEVRNGGLKGPRVNPGQLNLCTVNGLVQLPKIWGATSWDDATVHPKPRRISPQGNSNCIQSTWTNTSNPPVGTTRAGNGTATLSWPTPPGGTNAVSVLIQKYYSSNNTWGSSTWKRISGAPTSYTVGGLDNGRTYRMLVAFHNTGGWSKYSAPTNVIPGSSVPAVPRSPLFLTWPRADYIHYGWEVPNNGGSPLTAYTTEYRCLTSSGFGAWVRKNQTPDKSYANLSDVSAFRGCEVKVRAGNKYGASGWSVISTIRR